MKKYKTSLDFLDEIANMIDDYFKTLINDFELEDTSEHFNKDSEEAHMDKDDSEDPYGLDKNEGELPF